VTTSPLRDLVRTVVDVVAAAIGLSLLLRGAIDSMRPGTRRRPPAYPQVLWGSQPITALSFMAQSARRAGYDGAVVVRGTSPIYSDDAFEHRIYRIGGNVVLERLIDSVKAYAFLADSLARYDVFAYYFDGGVLRRTALRKLELPLLKLLRKKVVLFPYGSDAWVADHTGSLPWRAALIADYPSMGERAPVVEHQIRQGCRYADCVVGCLAHIACLPRWDILPLVCYPIDTHARQPVPPRTDGPIRVAHAANHRGFKGTSFIIAAIDRLRAEGHEIEFDLIERTPNPEVLERMAAADIYVDQVVVGYAFAALEAMALGKVVLSPVGGTGAYDVFRRYSYLNECPIVNVSVETVYDVLRALIERRHEWPEIGRASREFCERRHSFDASAEMWDAIFRRIWFREKIDLINFYDPLHEPRRRPHASRSGRASTAAGAGRGPL
jgi:hypothetical protein